MREIYAALPDDWRLFIEHKFYEPAFYSTVINDWGTSYYCARELGPKAFCLVDLGHHAPNVNIEMIVARLIQFGKLGGFHFNDSKYGDDDLDSGSIKPFQLFLIFNELVDAELRRRRTFNPAYMLDQSHNVTDPIESLMMSAGRGGARLCPGPSGRSRRAERSPGALRSADGAVNSEARLHHRRVADSRQSARARRRRDRSHSDIPGQRLPAPQIRRASRDERGSRIGNCLVIVSCQWFVVQLFSCSLLIVGFMQLEPRTTNN